METMGKLIKMNVLIVGCRGVGVETAKNLILAGPASVTIFDQTLVSINDLGSNFYCKPEDVGKQTRAQASYSKLQELNPYVKVQVINKLEVEDLANYHVVCITELYDHIDKIIEANEFCRSKNIGFILASTFGPTGFTFLDYGNDFTITDPNGEDTKSFIIVNVT